MPDWQRAREILAPVAARARRGDTINIESLHHATLETYQIANSQVAPLLAWSGETLRSPTDTQTRAAS